MRYLTDALAVRYGMASQSRTSVWCHNMSTHPSILATFYLYEVSGVCRAKAGNTPWSGRKGRRLWHSRWYDKANLSHRLWFLWLSSAHRTFDYLGLWSLLFSPCCCCCGIYDGLLCTRSVLLWQIMAHMAHCHHTLNREEVVLRIRQIYCRICHETGSYTEHSKVILILRSLLQ